MHLEIAWSTANLILEPLCCILELRFIQLISFQRNAVDSKFDKLSTPTSENSFPGPKASKAPPNDLTQFQKKNLYVVWILKIDPWRLAWASMKPRLPRGPDPYGDPPRGSPWDPPGTPGHPENIIVIHWSHRFQSNEQIFLEIQSKYIKFDQITCILFPKAFMGGQRAILRLSVAVSGIPNLETTTHYIK